MTTSKAHQRRKRKGCWVCGLRFERDHTLPTAQRNTCVECFEGRKVLDYHHRPDEEYHLIVDGSFLTFSGERNVAEPGFGGAGLVLANSAGEVVISRSCGFEAAHSADAEFEAIRRGARWMPVVSIFTDSQSHASRMRGEMSRDVRYLSKRLRSEHYELAHELSVMGRLRFAAWYQENHAEVSSDHGEQEASSDSTAVSTSKGGGGDVQQPLDAGGDRQPSSGG